MAKELAWDQEQLLYALDHAYSGRRYLPAGEFDRVKAEIAEVRAPISAMDFCRHLARAFQNVSDNHLRARFPQLNCTENVSRRTPSVGKNYYKKNGRVWDARIEKRKNRRALLISILEFPSAKSPEWNGFLEAVRALSPSADLIIFDMRGNGGGDDGIGEKLSDTLAGTELRDPTPLSGPITRRRRFSCSSTTSITSTARRHMPGALRRAILKNCANSSLKNRRRCSPEKKRRIREQKDHGENFLYAKSVKETDLYFDRCGLRLQL